MSRPRSTELRDRVSVVLVQLEIPLYGRRSAWPRSASDCELRLVLDPRRHNQCLRRYGTASRVVKPNELEAEVLTGICRHGSNFC